MLLISTAIALASGTIDRPGRQFLRYLVGSWRVVSVDPGGGDDLRVCYSVRPFVGDKWLSGVATSRTPGFGSKDVWGYDGASGELMRTVFDSSGTYAVVRSHGWKGQVLVLRGEAKSAGGTMQVRETIRRLSGNEFTATWEALRGGKWKPYAIERATRALDGKCS
jgi:hypothetical protein